jgi:transposase
VRQQQRRTAAKAGVRTPLGRTREPHGPPGRELSSIQTTNARLYRAYLLKEQLRQIYRLPADAATRLLDEWLAWARRRRLPSFVKLARTITAQRAGIVAAIEHGLSNARVEAINTQIRMITRGAYALHPPATRPGGHSSFWTGRIPPTPIGGSGLSRLCRMSESCKKPLAEHHVVR